MQNNECKHDWEWTTTFIGVFDDESSNILKCKKCRKENTMKRGENYGKNKII